MTIFCIIVVCKLQSMILINKNFITLEWVWYIFSKTVNQVLPDVFIEIFEIINLKVVLLYLNTINRTALVSRGT